MVEFLASRPLCARLIGDQTTNELNGASSYLSSRPPNKLLEGWRSVKVAPAIRIDISTT